MKFKHVVTYISKEAAENYKVINEALGYAVKIIKTPLIGNNFEWNVYQSREKTRR